MLPPNIASPEHTALPEHPASPEPAAHGEIGAPEQAAPPAFPPVAELLENSMPHGSSPMRFWLAAAVLVVALNLVTRSLPADQRADANAAASLLLFLFMIAVALVNWMRFRAARREIGNLVAAEELVQLRHWPQAAGLLVGMLLRPMRSHQTRAQALVFYSSTLMRFHRFTDVIEITEYLLDRLQLDPGAQQALKLSRAMAMLREDHLFDADRAISDLRRGPLAKTSAGLALVEIYRDVKTGHPDDAIHTFESRLDMLRSQLGHRVADAFALIAKAYDLLNRPAEAAAAWAKATLLAPAVELQRRYPEIASLSGKYPMTAAPMEVA